MGMVKCRECGKEVSEQAKICPQCGIEKPVPPSKAGQYLKLGFGAVIVAGMVQCINKQDAQKAIAETELRRVESSKTPEQRAKEIAENEKAEADFQSVVSRLRALRALGKNPASFELVEATLMKDDTVCVVYRGTNSFNAVVTESKAIAKNLRVVEWNRFCAGKSGKDMMYARRAL